MKRIVLMFALTALLVVALSMSAFFGVGSTLQAAMQGRWGDPHTEQRVRRSRRPVRGLRDYAAR